MLSMLLTFFAVAAVSKLMLLGCSLQICVAVCMCLCGVDRDAVVVLIRWMPLLLVGTEGGTVNTTTKERHNRLKHGQAQYHNMSM